MQAPACASRLARSALGSPSASGRGRGPSTAVPPRPAAGSYAVAGRGPQRSGCTCATVGRSPVTVDPRTEVRGSIPAQRPAPNAERTAARCTAEKADAAPRDRPPPSAVRPEAWGTAPRPAASVRARATQRAAVGRTFTSHCAVGARLLPSPCATGKTTPVRLTTSCFPRLHTAK